MWIALGMAGGYVPFVALYLIPWWLGLEGPQAIEVLAVLPLAVVPLTFAYAILRFRLWDISVIARDVATYGLTILFGLAGFSFLRLLVAGRRARSREDCCATCCRWPRCW